MPIPINEFIDVTLHVLVCGAAMVLTWSLVRFACGVLWKAPQGEHLLDVREASRGLVQQPVYERGWAVSSLLRWRVLVSWCSELPQTGAEGVEGLE